MPMFRFLMLLSHCNKQEKPPSTTHKLMCKHSSICRRYAWDREHISTTAPHVWRFAETIPFGLKNLLKTTKCTGNLAACISSGLKGISIK